VWARSPASPFGQCRDRRIAHATVACGWSILNGSIDQPVLIGCCRIYPVVWLPMCMNLRDGHFRSIFIASPAQSFTVEGSPFLLLGERDTIVMLHYRSCLSVLILAVLFAPPLPLSAQTVGTTNQQFLYQTYSIREGLPSPWVHDIMEDRDGFLWFATDGGAARFDGHDFHVLTVADGLADNQVTTVFQDSRGTLWICTRDDVARLDGLNLSLVAGEGGPVLARVIAMAEESNGTLWFGCLDHGLWRYDGTLFTHFTAENGLPSPGVRDVLVDTQGRVWVVALGGGAARVEGDTIIPLVLDETDPRSRMGWQALEDRDGRLWFSTDAGLFEVDNEAVVLHPLMNPLRGLRAAPQAMIQDRSGALWLGLVGGMILQYDQGEVEEFPFVSNQIPSIIRAIVEDSEGNLWFGTNGAGVVQYKGAFATRQLRSDGRPPAPAPRPQPPLVTEGARVVVPDRVPVRAPDRTRAVVPVWVREVVRAARSKVALRSVVLLSWHLTIRSIFIFLGN